MDFSNEDYSSSMDNDYCSKDTQRIDQKEGCEGQDCNGLECCQQCHFQTFLISKIILINPSTSYYEDFVDPSAFESKLLFEVQIPPIKTEFC